VRVFLQETLATIYLVLFILLICILEFAYLKTILFIFVCTFVRGVPTKMSNPASLVPYVLSSMGDFISFEAFTWL
jgi:hypothetical protein